MSLHSLRLVTQSPIPDALIRLDDHGQPVVLVEADLLATYGWAEFLSLNPSFRPDMQPGEVSFKGTHEGLAWSLHYVPETVWDSTVQQTGTFKAVSA